jgi:hypothetical protein
MHDWITDNMLFVPIIEGRTGYIVRDNVKDAEYAFWGMQWKPFDMWYDE